MSDFVSLQDVARMFGVTENTVRSMVARGDLPAYRVGPKLIRFKRVDIEAVLRPINQRDA